MATSPEMLAAFRELTTTKQLDRAELLELLRDGIQAALVRKFGPNVRFELSVDELNGSIRIVRLRQVVDAVEDPSWQISLEDAQFEDPDFAVGDMLEEDVPFAEFGRLAVQAAKQRIIQRVREGERSRIRDEFGNKVGELLSGEVQQIERGKLVIMLNKPIGYTCSTRDPGRVVYDLLPPRFLLRSPVMSTVGRLDRDTSGLLLLTDDGALLHRITSPRRKLPKVYEATLARDLRGDEGKLFASGKLMLESEQTPLAPATLEVLGPRQARHRGV